MATFTPIDPTSIEKTKVLADEIEEPPSDAISTTSTLTQITNITALHPNLHVQRSTIQGTKTENNKLPTLTIIGPNPYVQNPNAETIPPPTTLEQQPCLNPLDSITHIIARSDQPSSPPPRPPSCDPATGTYVVYESATHEPMDSKARPLAWLKFREMDSVFEDEDWGTKRALGEQLTDAERIGKWVGEVRHGEWEEGGLVEVEEPESSKPDNNSS